MSTPVVPDITLTDKPLWRRLPEQTVVITVLLTMFGFSMVFQSARWAHTPAYGNLLRILPAPAWGCIHLAAAAFLVTGMVMRTHRRVQTAAHMFTLALLLAWWGAFLVRYVTDHGTTIANVGSWGLALYVLLQSARLIDDRRVG